MNSISFSIFVGFTMSCIILGYYTLSKMSKVLTEVNEKLANINEALYANNKSAWAIMEQGCNNLNNRDEFEKIVAINQAILKVMVVLNKNVITGFRGEVTEE